MLAGLEVWDLIAATRLGKPRARRARSSGPAQMMAVMRLRLKSPHSQSPSWLSWPRTSRTSRASLGLICMWFMVSVRRGSKGGWRRAPRGTASMTSPAGRPGGPLRVVAAGRRSRTRDHKVPAVKVPQQGGAGPSAV